MHAERQRLAERDPNIGSPWYKWGPYLSDRSWATVREDYSPNGDAWTYFSFEQAHRKVYRWGEDGIAGWSDRYQLLAFAPAFWNGKDPILKERLFGLNCFQGNHSEDVKELYYYLDATPTHSYMKFLYKYPQAPFPYQQLQEKNEARALSEPEYELIDTGIFDQNGYFDITVEYAKASAEDTSIRITAINRGQETAPLHILPHLWFRNQWSWGDAPLPTPSICLSKTEEAICLVADDSAMPPLSNLPFSYALGKRFLYAQKGGAAFFTDNEDAPDAKYTKDAFHRYLIEGEKKATNPRQVGTKACIHYRFNIAPGASSTVFLRLTDQTLQDPFHEIDELFESRKKEADQFYASIHPPKATQEESLVQRQALAGMIWTKQFYLFDVALWLKGDNTISPPPSSRQNIRNEHWRHLNTMRILSMPDKWEYPWFAAWDLAFHTVSFALVDIEFAKEQLALLLFEQFQHPNGAIPAYEWNFSDLNPPIQAWAAYRLFQMEEQQTGKGDTSFLKRCFYKLLLNFCYWVNQVDSSGCNVFEGGFLGLDNITLLDRSEKLGDNVILKQSDGTGWMAMFCLNLMRISLELAKTDSSYEEIATKFFQHFVHIGYAMKTRDNKPYSLWDDEDGFFYDVLLYPDGHYSPFKVRSLVGLIPLFAVETLTQKELEQYPQFYKHFQWFLRNRSEKTAECVHQTNGGYLLSLVNWTQLKKLLSYLQDPEEFRSPFGIRSLSKFHEKHPFIYKETQVGYEPGNSMHKIKGGNSNWRGPIWLPTNYLLIQSLKKFDAMSKKDLGLKNAYSSFANSLISLFLRGPDGVRPVFCAFAKAQDSHFKDLILFHEFFHAETGEGLGASHQTGWTGLIANLIDEFRQL